MVKQQIINILENKLKKIKFSRDIKFDLNNTKKYSTYIRFDYGELNSIYRYSYGYIDNIKLKKMISVKFDYINKEWIFNSLYCHMNKDDYNTNREYRYDNNFNRINNYSYKFENHFSIHKNMKKIYNIATK